ncbi:MAG: archaemetzincin [Myxococcota bacterium]
MSERDFLPWWVRHRRWLAVVGLLILVALAGIFIVYPLATAPVVGAPTQDQLPSAFTDDSGFEPLADPASGSWRDRFDEPIQDYDDWLDTRPDPPSKSRHTIYLQPIGDFDGVAPDLTREQVVLRRNLKIVLHELGHTFGIRHCQHYKCIMNGSNSLRETDEAPLHMCPVDLRKLQHAVGFDIDQRYRELGDFYEKHGLMGEARFVLARAAE